MPAQSFNSIVNALAAMGNGISRVIVNRGDATGDMPHVMAALANDASRGVIVVDGSNSTAGGLARIANVYVDQFGIDGGRVKFVNLAGGVVPNPPKTGSNWIASGRNFTLFPLTKSTNFLRDDLALLANNPHVFSNVKRVLRGETLHSADITVENGQTTIDVVNMNFLDPQCAAFWIGRNIQFASNTVVLWGRESGRAGGMHPNHDHSYTGMWQIIQRCAAAHPPIQVIVAGDFRSVNDQGIATQVRQDIGANAIVIGKYWEAVPLFSDRFNQVRLFYVLKKMLKVNHAKLVHVGMRSGGLDMFGFSGQPTIYISKAQGDDRMAAVAQAFSNAGMATQYQKQTVQQLPKRGPHDGNKHGRTTAQRGFLPADLDDLMDKIDDALA